MEQCASCAIESDLKTKVINKEILFKIKQIQLSCVRKKSENFSTEIPCFVICDIYMNVH